MGEHLVGVYRLVGFLRAVESDAAVGVDKQNLPVGTEVAENTSNGTDALGTQLVLERCVRACADNELVAIGVLYIAVGGFAACKRLSGGFKTHTVDSHKAALPHHKLCLVGLGGIKGRHRGDSRVDLRGRRQTAHHLDVLCEKSIVHKAHALVADSAELHKSAIAANGKVAGIDCHFLAELIGLVQFVVVYRESQRPLLPGKGIYSLNYDILVDIAGFVARGHAAFKNHGVAIGHISHLLGSAFDKLPELGLEFGYGGSGNRIDAFRHDHRRTGEVVVAAR